MGRLRLLATGTLVLGGGLLLVAQVREAAGRAELAELRMSMAASGGGVVFVRNAEDCAEAAGPVEFAAAALQEQGIVVQGVVLERGPVDVAVRLASESFPYGTLSPRATLSLAVLGHAQTPLALVVDPSGAVVKVEAFGGHPLAEILESLETE